MDWWVERIRELETKSQIMAGLNPIGYEPLKIYMLKKYVDDCLVILETMKLGVRWDSELKLFRWTQESEEEDKSNRVHPVEHLQVLEVHI